MMHASARSIVIKVAGTVTLIGAVALVAILAATPSSQGLRSHARTPATSGPKRSLDASVAKTYTSLQQLRQDAASVAVLKPSGVTRVETVAGIPFTLATVAVAQTISGAALPSTLELRQLGNGSDSRFPLVSDAKAYLAYLQPFEFERGAPIAGQYVVIGGLQGLFEGTPTSPSGASASFARVDPDATALPSNVTVQQAASSQ